MATEKQNAQENTAPVKKRRSKKSRRRARRIGFVVTLSVLLILLIGAAVAAVILGHNIHNSGKTLPNVYLDGVFVGDMTREEVVQTLLDSGWDERYGGTLKVTLPAEIEFELDYYEAGISFTAEEAAEFAMRYGHEGSEMDSLAAYIDNMSHAVETFEGTPELNEDYIREKASDGAARFELRTAFGDYKIDKTKNVITMLKGGGQITVDRDALTEQVLRALQRRDTQLNCSFTRDSVSTPDFYALYDELHVEPEDAYYDPVNDVVVPEVEGFTFDPAEAQRIWEETETASELSIPVTFLHPTLTASELQDLLFRDTLGSKTTYFRGSTGNRINNIWLVCQKLDGLILLPGEQFSYNGFIGERTLEAGFKYAGAYDNGKEVQEIGGGICQTSSTLYNAVLQANLQVDERTYHYFEVTYLPKGLDATVSWPGPDFKFTNNRDYPIRIHAECDRENYALTMEIIGSNVDGTYCIPESKFWQWYDDEYPTVQIGWTADSYRVIYDKDGNEISRTKEARSFYWFHDKDIKWPKEKTDPTPPPAPEPTPPPDPDPEPEPEPTPDTIIEG